MPRSPSRDRSDRFTGNRAYSSEPDWLRRWKTRAVVAALALVLAWLFVELALPSRAATFHTHGPLANPHAAWDADCAACHKPHGWDGVGSILNARDRWHDLTCTKCHAGPAHHATTADGGAFHNRCSNCHHDHQGRAASLVSISDEHCTKCHADLAASHVTGSPEFAPKIGHFVKDHPEFAALREYPPPTAGDPGRPYEPRRLKFSHALHMTPGLAAGEGGREALTAGRMKALFGDAAADRYRGSSLTADSLISLECASCHQLDSERPGATATDTERLQFDHLTAALRGEPRASVLPPRAAGAYYLPVNFDAHCKACHPIQAPAGVSGGVALKEFPLPHRRQAAELKQLLKGEYAARLAAGGHPAMAAPTGPGGRVDPQTTPAVAAFGGEVDRLTDSAMKLLFAGAVPAGRKPAPSGPDQFRVAPGGYACGKCHYAAGSGPTPEVAPLPDRTVWFTHAKFDHAAHRGLACASCHPGTEAPDGPVGTVNEVEPVLISGVDSCRACHAPTGTPVKYPNGQAVSALGTRHRCVDCHRYHNGDRPLQGRGATAWEPIELLKLDAFIRGGKAEK